MTAPTWVQRAIALPIVAVIDLVFRAIGAWDQYAQAAEDDPYA